MEECESLSGERRLTGSWKEADNENWPNSSLRSVTPAQCLVPTHRTEFAITARPSGRRR